MELLAAIVAAATIAIATGFIHGLHIQYTILLVKLITVIDQ
jgi:hypothetical protein